MTSTPYSVVWSGGVRNKNATVSASDATLHALYLLNKRPKALDTHVDEYHTSNKEFRTKVKLQLPYFVGGTLDGPRNDQHVTNRTLLTLDIEHNPKKQAGPPPSPEVVVAALRELGSEGWVYTSLSHTKSSPRYRVVLPLGKFIPQGTDATSTLEATTLGAARKLGVEEWCDPISWTLSQPMFLPAQLDGGLFEQWYVAGDKSWKPVRLKTKRDREAGVPADIPDEQPDPIVGALKRAGLYLSEDTTQVGRHYFACPWHEQHSTTNDTQTMYMAAHHNGFAHWSCKCLGTSPDVDGKPHMTRDTLTRWLRTEGHLTAEEQANEGVLDDYDTFDRKADLGHMLDEPPVSRTWAIDKFAPVGKVTVLAGPGGVSKSMLMLHVLVYAAMGKDWANFTSAAPLKSLYVSYEDDTQELHKRVNTLAAAMRADDDGLLDTLYDVNGTIRQNLRMFAADDEAAQWLILTKPDRFGAPERSPRVDWLVGYLQAKQIRLLALDPAVYTHQLEENNIADMAAYMQTLTYIAKQAQCAVVVLHHMHKVAGWAAIDEINQGSLRGASSFADNARSVAVVVSMPIKDAEAYGLPADHATTGRYAVLKHVKHNYSAPMETMVFERMGAILKPRPDITKMDRNQLAEARETAKTEEADRRVHQWVERVLETLSESDSPVSATQLAVDLNTRNNRLKPVIDYCETNEWVEVEDGPNRSKLHSLTRLGKTYLKTLRRKT